MKTHNDCPSSTPRLLLCGVRISPEQREHCEAMSLEACAPALPLQVAPLLASPWVASPLRDGYPATQGQEFDSKTPAFSGREFQPGLYGQGA